MDSSSVCVRKQGKRWWRKTQRKSLLNTLDKTFLLIGNICSQFCGEKPLERVGKTGSKSLQKSLSKQPQMPHFIESGKLAVGVCQNCRSTARSTANGQKSDRWGWVDRPGRPNLWNREQTLCRSTGPVDRGFLESKALRTVDRPGQPSRSTGPPARLVHVCARLAVDRLTPGQK